MGEIPRSSEEENIEPVPQQSEQRSVFGSLEKRDYVTNRAYDQYLSHFSLPEKELEGRKVLDIGAGASTFISEVNERFGALGTVAVAMDPMYASLGNSFEEFTHNIGEEKMNWKTMKGNTANEEQSYQQIKATQNKVSGSHQELPFADNSFDLVLANNSISQYKDRGITKKALQEALRVANEHGEVRMNYIDLRHDKKTKELYLETFEDQTKQMQKEAYELKLAAAPDRELFEILKELEDAGLSIYAVQKWPRQGSGRMARLMNRGPTYALIIRKDKEIPEIDKTKSSASLKKLFFKASPDGFHVPSMDLPVRPKEEEEDPEKHTDFTS